MRFLGSLFCTAGICTFFIIFPVNRVVVVFVSIRKTISRLVAFSRLAIFLHRIFELHTLQLHRVLKKKFLIFLFQWSFSNWRNKFKISVSLFLPTFSEEKPIKNPPLRRWQFTYLLFL